MRSAYYPGRGWASEVRIDNICRSYEDSSMTNSPPNALGLLCGLVLPLAAFFGCAALVFVSLAITTRAPAPATTSEVRPDGTLGQRTLSVGELRSLAELERPPQFDASGHMTTPPGLGWQLGSTGVFGGMLAKYERVKVEAQRRQTHLLLLAGVCGIGAAVCLAVRQRVKERLEHEVPA
jgi:hypothetical protein